ncbi:hypothetical protein DYD21_08855 [Rhodohalobacter sp. SW132]|nr:hypothetical protein DYD21_08855 [Rhodohalobacter sp. SW132]
MYLTNLDTDNILINYENIIYLEQNNRKNVLHNSKYILIYFEYVSERDFFFILYSYREPLKKYKHDSGN